MYNRIYSFLRHFASTDDCANVVRTLNRRQTVLERRKAMQCRMNDRFRDNFYLKYKHRRFSHDLYFAIFEHQKGMKVSDFFQYQHMPLLPFPSLHLTLISTIFSGRNVIAKHMLFEGSSRNLHASMAIVQFYFFILPVFMEQSKKEADEGRGKKSCWINFRNIKRGNFSYV